MQEIWQMLFPEMALTKMDSLWQLFCQRLQVPELCIGMDLGTVSGDMCLALTADTRACKPVN